MNVNKDKQILFSDLEEGIWLVKVPLDVYNEINNASDGEKIGLLDFKINTKDKCLLNSKRENAVIKMKNKLEYKLNKTINTNLYVFKEDNATMMQISNKVNMLPLTEEVNNILSQKLYSESTTRSEIKKLDTNELEIVNNSAHGKIILNKGAPVNSKNDQNLKRIRGNKDVIKEKIFRMFEDNEHISRKEFFMELNEPHDYILEILNEICDTHQTGKKSNLYKLKKSIFGTNDD